MTEKSPISFGGESGTLKPTDEHLERVDDEDPGNINEPPFVWDLDIWLNLCGCWACFFTSTWLLVVPSSTIEFISAAFPEDASISIWIASTVTIANCVIQAFLGDLSDHFGRKWPLLLGMTLGFVGSLVASRASSMAMIIAGQVLNGIGLTCGYLAIPLTAEIVPKDQRARVQAASGIFAGVAYITGPIVAGAFIKHHVGGEGHGWRAAFYLAAGLCFVTFFIVLFCYNPAPRPNPENATVITRLLKTDWVGVFLVTAGITLFLVGIESGGNPSPWISGRVLSCIIIGGVLMILFGAWDGVVLFGGQAFLPQEIISLFTGDAIMTGVYNIPFNSLTIGGAMIAAVIMGITREAKWIIVVSFVLFLIGNCLMLVMRPHISYAAWFFPTALLGAAVGIQTSLLIVVVSVCTPNELIATAISVAAASRALGGSIGTVIFSQIFSSKLRGYLSEDISAQVTAAGLPETSVSSLLKAVLADDQDALSSIPGVTPSILAAALKGEELAYAHAFKFVWYSLIPFVALSLVVALFLKPIKQQLIRQVVAQVDRKH
ncbi:hypothetical protein FE257_010703 [Aspergillus nanangensis]|uniref:Major facilitator superfamily (MFS) profile domain-containing protein n=1 Tax=Aspergillus nanangensis TaxID=2582783 RepID=A0AAD4GRV3_ASPNN|nr:hypothetical protein FE257_010703 [Aspergillus nanangensis]